MRSVLLLYIPALHQGYIKLFQKYKAKVDTMYILDQDIIDDYPLAKREIRQLSPSTVLDLLDFSPKVELASKTKLRQLAKESGLTIITSTEQIADDLIQKYFSHLPRKSIIQEPVFLRYDEKMVKAARQEAAFTGTVTKDQLHKKIMESAQQAKDKSTDYFLQVGVVLVPKDHAPIFSHNQRMPSPHAMHSVGDPRNYLPYGTDTHQRTTLHAEQNLIAQAAREGINTQGSSLYTTTFPCPDCCNLLAEAGIKKIYFEDGYSELSSDDVLKAYGVEIVKVI